MPRSFDLTGEELPTITIPVEANLPPGGSVTITIPRRPGEHHQRAGLHRLRAGGRGARLRRPRRRRRRRGDRGDRGRGVAAPIDRARVPTAGGAGGSRAKRAPGGHHPRGEDEVTISFGIRITLGVRFGPLAGGSGSSPSVTLTFFWSLPRRTVSSATLPARRIAIALRSLLASRMSSPSSAITTSLSLSPALPARTLGIDAGDQHAVY